MAGIEASALDVALVVVRLVVGCWLMWRVPTLSTDRSAVRRVARSPVAFVVPARDEAASIATLLDSVDLRPDDELVVVDDHSVDATASIAAGHGARVVTSPDLPPGWTGKTWACHAGAGATTAPTLAFVDADVRFADGGVEAVLTAHTASGGLVSVQPHHTPGRPLEQLAMLTNIVGFAATGAAAPFGRAAGAFGPVLVTSRSDLEAVGGHESVRGSVVEDLALADRYRGSGLGVRILAGGDLVSFRMYPDGFRSLVQGFRKNLAGGMIGVRPSAVVLVVAWLTLLVQATGWLVRAPVTGEWLDAGVLYALVVIQVAWMARRVGRFSPLAWLSFPISLFVFFGVFVLSTVDLLRGRTTWKGRAISLRRSR